MTLNLSQSVPLRQGQVGVQRSCFDFILQTVQCLDVSSRDNDIIVDLKSSSEHPHLSVDVSLPFTFGLWPCFSKVITPTDVEVSSLKNASSITIDGLEGTVDVDSTTGAPKASHDVVIMPRSCQSAQPQVPVHRCEDQDWQHPRF